ncbi:MAG: hypothetical protein KGI37_06335 [Alphaproteobacteria bacterium]|nr:hypothetical protein [Alphaproteobacteria bacterium]
MSKNNAFISERTGLLDPIAPFGKRKKILAVNLLFCRIGRLAYRSVNSAAFVGQALTADRKELTDSPQRCLEENLKFLHYFFLTRIGCGIARAQDYKTPPFLVKKTAQPVE